MVWATLVAMVALIATLFGYDDIGRMAVGMAAILVAVTAAFLVGFASGRAHGGRDLNVPSPPDEA